MRGSAWLLAAALGGAVALAGPAGAQEAGGRVVLRWQAVPGAAGYDLQVASDPSFTHRELERRVDLAGYRLGPPPEARRYWRVRTVDADGRPGPWSSVKVIEPRPAVGEEVAPTPPPVPEPAPLVVPPLPAERLAEPAPAEATAPPEVALLPRAAEEPAPLAVAVDEEPEGIGTLDVLRSARPGLLLGWRHNLLGVAAPALALEAAVPLPWLGASWWGAVRAGWWHEGVTVPGAGAVGPGLDATADVVPLHALVFRAFAPGWARWARPYAGAGLGADLVVVRLPGEGALEATAALHAIAGAGRPLGRGELFAEVAGSLGGVDGPLGRLRTGGVSLSVGYRLGR